MLSGTKSNKVSIPAVGDQHLETSELNEAYDTARDAITSLMKTSIIIRDATPRDRYMKALTSTRNPFINSFDIAHVGHKFPRLNDEGREWLKERLGKAITQRRQYLRYCREHHDKFQDPERGAESSSKTHPYIDVFKSEARSQSHGGTLSSLTASALAPTDASTLQKSWLNPIKARATDATEDVSDSLSHTSYATSVHTDGRESRLHPPSLQDIAQAFPFECPYCWTLQELTNEKAWR